MNLYTIRKKVASNKFFELFFKPIYMKTQKVYFRERAKKNIRKEEVRISEKNIWFLDIPTHTNLGDLAQYWKIKQWLCQYYSGYVIHDISALTICNAEKEFIELIKKRKKGDLIFFQSGYCTQDLGGTHDYVHRSVVEIIKDTPIIMMPQTIYFKNKKNEKRTADIYAKNNNLLLLCRDEVSFNNAKRIFPNNKALSYPDIVTSMIGKIEVLPKDLRDGILLCCRDDSEKYYNERAIDFLCKELKKIGDVSRSDTTIACDFSKLKDIISESVMDLIHEYMKYELIITDRYHGTIFSLIAGTPVIVIKSNDHKVVTGVDWFKEVYKENICYVDNIKDVPKVAEKMINKCKYKKLNSYFDEKYYAKLKEIIENWIENI
ncbi:polysaccharide pyruvyl transferase family protein [uncultured Dubosiella sp.]|uniref:polysaccharide pyruvyl transferase family protein n=1 Tax=uncultured Dubosiella sp. TaxID=1937011 RepID=UPI0032B27F0A